MSQLKVFLLIATLVIISSLCEIARAQTSETDIENIKNQIANLMQQLTRLQNSLETIAPDKFRCNSDSDCSFCGLFCTHKDIAKYCPQMQPKPGYSCVCREGRCTTEIIASCIRATPEITINPNSRLVEPGEQAVYQGVLINRDSIYCNLSRFEIKIECPQNFVCNVTPDIINMTATLTLRGIQTFRVLVQSPNNAEQARYNFTVLAINKYNESLIGRATGSYVIGVKEDTPKGTLKIDNKIVKVGENITLTIEASDENGLDSVMAFFKGKWNTKNCNKEKSCKAEFTFVEETPGIKFYYGYVRGYSADGKRIEGTFTRPPFVEVRVVEEIPRNECIRSAPQVDIEPKYRKGAIGDTFEYRIYVKSTDRNCERSSFKLEAECQEGLECRIEEASVMLSRIIVKTTGVKEIGSYKIKVKAINEYDTTLIGEAEATVEIVRETIEKEDRASGVLVADKYRIIPGENVSITINASDDNGLHSISLYTSERRWETFECNKSKVCSKTWTFNETTQGIKNYYGIIRGYKTDGSIELVYTNPPMITIIVRESYQPTTLPEKMLECSKNEDCFWCGNTCMNRKERVMCPMVMPPPGYACVCENGRCTAKKQ
ncbi:MAG: hypothetical protein QXJ25_02815 [Candidatus Aenigmatarchaeota archaeon]